VEIFFFCEDVSEPSLSMICGEFLYWLPTRDPYSMASVAIIKSCLMGSKGHIVGKKCRCVAQLGLIKFLEKGWTRTPTYKRQRNKETRRI
jgi:hypothetical protein